MKKIVLILIFINTSFTLVGMEELQLKLLPKTPNAQTMELINARKRNKQRTHSPTPSESAALGQRQEMDQETAECCCYCCSTCVLGCIVCCVLTFSKR